MPAGDPLKSARQLGLRLPGIVESDDDHDDDDGNDLDEAVSTVDDVMALATSKRKRKRKSSASIGASQRPLGVTESGAGRPGSLLQAMGLDKVGETRDADGRLRESHYLPTDQPMARRRGGLLEAMLPADIVDEMQSQRLREAQSARIRATLAGL